MKKPLHIHIERTSAGLEDSDSFTVWHFIGGAIIAAFGIATVFLIFSL